MPAVAAGPSARDPQGARACGERGFTCLHTCTCVHVQVQNSIHGCVRANAHMPRALCNCVSAVACPSCQRVPLGDMQRWPVAGKGCFWVTHT